MKPASRRLRAPGRGTRRLALVLPTALLALTAVTAPGYADDTAPDDGGTTAVPEAPAAPAPEPAPEPKPEPEAPAVVEEPVEEPAATVEETVEEPAAPAAPPTKSGKAGDDARAAANLVGLVEELNLDKVVVCKYSATPEVGEKAQTINITNTSSLGDDWPGYLPYPFNDAQGLSLGVKHPLTTENTGDYNKQEVIDLLCPPLQEAVPPTLEKNDPCGTGNAAWIPPAETDAFTVTVNPDGSITLMVKPGYFFDNGDFVYYTYPAPTETNTDACVVTPPVEPQPTDPCGLRNAYYPDAVVPASTAGYTVTTEKNGLDQVIKITVTPTAGNVFPGGVDEIVWTPVDSNAPCTVTPPVEPQPEDPCGLDNAYYEDADVPASTAGYTVTTEKNGLDQVIKITLTPTPGNVFPGGVDEIVWTPVDSNTPCIVGITEPQQTDPCGLDNAYYDEEVVPTETAFFTVATEENELGQVVKITITAKPGTVFDENDTTELVWTVEDSNVPCVIPLAFEAAPADPCGLDNAYFVDGVVPASIPGVYDVTTVLNELGQVVSITVTTLPGWVFDLELGTTELTFTAVDSDEPCILAPFTEPAPQDPCGLDNAYFADADIPESTETFTVEVNEDATVITLTATPGNVFDLGEGETGTELVFTAVDSGEPCVFGLVEPAVTDPCGPDNAYYAADDIPLATDAYTVDVNEDASVITITATPGNDLVEIAPRATQLVFTATDSGEKCDEIGGIVETLPNTGGPGGWLLPLGVALMLAGAGVLMARRPHSA